MKKITKTISIFVIACIYATVGAAQINKMCATDEMVAKSLQENPHLLQNYLAEQARLQQLDQAAAAAGYPEQYQRGPIYTIPVVFHVLHQNGAENISDAQINDAIRILNEDYSKTNADISQVVPTFTNITGNPELNFVLAKKDPNGNCTNGIDRIVSNETNVGDNGSMINIWNPTKYLNVYTVKTISSGAAGYTYLPGSIPTSNDAIMILNTYIGSIGTGSAVRSRALTHEVGHWFGLPHVWGGSNNPGVACGDDGISDTPQTMGWTSCNTAGNTCGGSIDNVQNYLEYSYCSKMFTVGQAAYMRNVATSSFYDRITLWSSSNLIATGVSTAAVICKADFKSSNTENSICQGGSLTFTDLSWNGTPTSWTWSFQGGTPSSSSLASPTIQYNTPGIYNVSLTVSNVSGSVSATKIGYVIVYATPGLSGTPFYTEGFEGAAIPNTTWQVTNNNSGSNTWVQTSTAAASGTKSIRILNASTYDGYVDELIGPSLNMTTFGTSPQLKFKVAHAQKTATIEDQLAVLVSTNCGQTWSTRLNLKGATLATVPIQSTSFTPTATQWVTKTVNLNAFAAQTNLLVMFRFTSNGGNNVFLDDINIAGTISGTGVADDFSSSLNFNLYPNPLENNSVVTFTLPEKQTVDIKIVDILGKEIATLHNGNLNAGDYQYAISDNTKLSSGIYFVKLTVSNMLFTKKLIVK